MVFGTQRVPPVGVSVRPRPQKYVPNRTGSFAPSAKAVPFPFKKMSSTGRLT
jgi:hypothetical protein